MVDISNIHHKEIITCINKLFETTVIDKIDSLFWLLYKNKEEELRKVINDIDNQIGGNYLFNLICHPVIKINENGRKQIHYTGLYRIEDRDIFRPLQYASICFESDNKNLHRYSVHMSCVHVEAVCKRILEEQGLKVGHLPLGPLIKNLTRCKIETVNDEIVNILQDITSVYNIAKHDCSIKAIPSERRNQKDLMMFTLAETIFMFFICRKVALLLDPSIASFDRFRIVIK